MVHGGMSIIKYLTFFFNFLFVLFGLVFIVIGSLALGGVEEFSKISSKLHAPIILLIVLGCAVLLLSFFGCCGAIKENYCMLMTFSVIIFLIFIVELAVGISAYVFRNKISENIKEASKEILEKYNNDSSDKDFWDNIQKTYNCCGIDGPKDWEETFPSPKLPDSCCFTNATTCQMGGDNVRLDGCYNEIVKILKEYSWKIGIAALVIAFLQLVGMIFGCCLARSIKKEYETV
ncbi:CD63 antigen-like [Centruroides vittatus]|uniref:CD63 antigen-like n=1 Tax=Centruroides vittatus TaxID=120091 RepID=UPI00350FF673